MIEGKTKEAIKLAAQMLVENGLSDWRLSIKDVTSYHAQTDHEAKIITYSSRFIKVATKEQFIGITHHELSHALVGPYNGHNSVFTSQYYKLAGNYEYAVRGANVPIQRFVTHCKTCGTISGANGKLDKLRFCKVCWSDKKVSIVTVMPNPLQEIKW